MQGDRGIKTIEEALLLFDGYLPDNCRLSIEQTDSKLMNRYIMRVHYTSPNSKRTMCVMAKGDTLPQRHDHLFDFYLRQLVLSPRELAREFTHLRYLEQRARQDEFLFGSSNVRVAQAEGLKDRILNAFDRG